MQQGSLPQLLSAESATTAAAQVRHRVAWCPVVRNGAAWRGMRHSTAMSRFLLCFVAYCIRRRCAAYSVVLKLESADC
jgi:hypothetical protein